MLDLRDLDVFYGGIRALNGVSLHVGEGELVTLIGSNGAGKTTTLRTISGLLRPRRGEIVYEGKPIHTLSPDQIVARGISQCPEGRLIFGSLTVDENLRLGAVQRRDAAAVRRDREWVYTLFPVLVERLGQLGGTLSGGEQQMLAIGRSLMCRPRLLLLDEPSLGLAPVLVERIFDVLRQLKEGGGTILLVEQNAHLALEIADRGYVLETGRLILHDTAGALRANAQVERSYLGG
ncbi:MAG: ABC transporter ATP-binding protein [Alphaproteobacteria bacterium]